MTTKSPCKEICDYVPDAGHCMSCGRTLQEIEEWFKATQDRKKQIIRESKQRLKNLTIPNPNDTI